MSYNSNDVIEEPPKKKRKIVTPEGRAVIVNMYKFLKVEYLFTMMHKDCKCDLSHLRNIARRTADATNVSLRTVARALSEDRRTNPMNDDKKIYKFKKSKPSIHIIPEAEAEQLRQELELMETATLAEMEDEDRSFFEAGTSLGSVKVKKEAEEDVIILEETEVKKEVEEDVIILEETEVKKEVEEEDIVSWEEPVVKTEEEEEITGEEELEITDDIDIKEEAYDYEITIKGECIF